MFSLNKIFILSPVENFQVEQELRLIWLHKSFWERSWLWAVSSLLGRDVKYVVTTLQTKNHRDKKRPQMKDDDINALLCNRASWKIIIFYEAMSLSMSLSSLSRLFNTKKSALSQHVMDFDHRIDWDNVKILKSESHAYRRRVAESFLINQKACWCNITNRNDGATFPTVYSVLVSNK